MRCSSGVLTSGCNVRSLHADHATQLSETFPLKRPGQELALTVAHSNVDNKACFVSAILFRVEAAWPSIFARQASSLGIAVQKRVKGVFVSWIMLR